MFAPRHRKPHHAIVAPSRLRVSGEINEVHTEDLQFNLDETMDFFQRSGAENFTTASISTLHNSVEG